MRKILMSAGGLFVIAVLLGACASSSEPAAVLSYDRNELDRWSEVLDRHISVVCEGDIQGPPYIQDRTLLGYAGKSACFYMADMVVTRIVFTFPADADLYTVANRISEVCGEATCGETYPDGGAVFQWEVRHCRFVLATDGKEMTLTATKY